MRRIATILFLMLAASPCASVVADEAKLNDAQRLYMTGRYEESQEQYEKLAADQPARAAVGIARCRIAVGQYDDAAKLLGEAIQKEVENAPLSAELARLQFNRGNYEAAQEHCQQALAKSDKQLLARWVQAELHRVGGKLDEAEKGYEWFVDYYNDADKIEDAESLYLIGQAAAQYARWTRNSAQFNFLVNRLYPQVLKLDENYWPAKLASGRLFLEKYNERDATTELNAALAINPNAAEVHVARAELNLQSFDLQRAESSIKRALEINPQFLPAKQLQADMLMAEFRVKEAISSLEEARQLNPRSDDTLGRLAAGFLFVDGDDDAKAQEVDSRLSKLVSEVQKRNAHCGQFYEALGDTLDLLRKYPAAERYYAASRLRMPQLISVPGKLGLVQMRLGDEAQAKKQLDESFEIDPFNVRVKNSLEVLDVLDNYAVIETEHFVIKFDRGQDQMLAEYAAEYLEREVYPDIVKQLGYEPAGKSLFEIFSRAKNTDGHGWFSARMVGLPYIGTVGACAGKMVAMVSPGDMPEPFNWARVLKHEFVHVVNLQQTDFNIPHWFTEALAVRSEGFPRPPAWTELLAKRHAEDTLFTLDDINHGFLRPGDADNWTLAYCQAEIYADYMVERFGEDALAKMLTAYADNLSTFEAIQRCFDMQQEDFEEGYRKFVAKIVAGVPAAKPQAAKSLAELEKAVADEPEDADLLAQLAYEQLKRKSNTDARRNALAALKQQAQHPLASYVLARLYLSIGDSATALHFLVESLQENAPQQQHLALLAALYVKAEKFADAERLYEIGAKHFPHDDAWPKRLASVHLKTGDDDKLAAVLKRLADLDTDNLAFRQKLAQLALAKKEYPAAERWAMSALQINILEPDMHALRAEALAAQKKHDEAGKEFGYALQINPDQLDWRMALAQAYVDAGKNVEAKLELEKLLEKKPDFPGAKELLGQLKQE